MRKRLWVGWAIVLLLGIVCGCRSNGRLKGITPGKDSFVTIVGVDQGDKSRVLVSGICSLMPNPEGEQQFSFQISSKPVPMAFVTSLVAPISYKKVSGTLLGTEFPGVSSQRS